MDDKTLTLEGIGKIAGVSRSTVSRVLNDHPDVRAEVRERVEKVIAETGYLPNQAARALVSSRTGRIALVMPTEVDELFGDPYYSALIDGIGAACGESGSIFSIFPVFASEDQRAVLASLVPAGFVDGVIVTAGKRSDDLIAALRDTGKNMIVVGRPIDEDGIVRVDVENRAGSASAVAHLAGLGRNRIAYIGPSADFLFGSERLDGYRDGCRAAGLGLHDELVHFAAPNVEGGATAMAALLPHRPDAIHIATDLMASGALAAVHEAGLSVPDDIAIVGFDGLPRATPTTPSLTTVVQPVSAVGRTAVELLLDDAPVTTILATTLHIAGSCGALTEPAA